MPRKSVSVPIVTASDGRPRPRDEEAVERPARGPPTASAAAIASQIDQPCVNASAITTPVRPSIDGDREVDLAGDHDQRDRQRHDRDLAHVQPDVEQGARRPEARARPRSRTGSSRRGRRRAASPSGRAPGAASAALDRRGVVGRRARGSTTASPPRVLRAGCDADRDQPVEGDRAEEQRSGDRATSSSRRA